MGPLELITDIVVIAAVAAGAVWLGSEAFLRRRLHRREVIVVLKGEAGSYRGILWRHHPNHLELRNAAFLQGEGSVPIDGAVILPRPNIAWIQDPRTEA